MPQNALISRLGIRNPVIQGPMSGGPSTPELVAAVSNAGGLGSLGAAYLTPGEITEAILRIKSLTSKPFNVNLFAGGYEAKAVPNPKPMLDVLAEIHAALGLLAPINRRDSRACAACRRACRATARRNEFERDRMHREKRIRWAVASAPGLPSISSARMAGQAFTRRNS